MLNDAPDVGHKVKALLSQSVLDGPLVGHASTFSSSRLTAARGGELK
jgi:hypothetical protein